MHDRDEWGSPRDREDYFHVHAILEECDVSKIDGTADELQRYLLHRYDERFHLRPHMFEDVVGQVFRNHGFHAQVTARSNDGGIDLIVGEKGGILIAVQVKRYKDKIEAALIREFAGALILGGATAGIFVTTSSFTSGAVATAERYRALRAPIRIELLDADRFYSAMSFRRYGIYSGVADTAAPFHEKWEQILRRYDHGYGWF